MTDLDVSWMQSRNKPVIVENPKVAVTLYYIEGYMVYPDSFNTVILTSAGVFARRPFTNVEQVAEQLYYAFCRKRPEAMASASCDESIREHFSPRMSRYLLVLGTSYRGRNSSLKLHVSSDCVTDIGGDYPGAVMPKVEGLEKIMMPEKVGRASVHFLACRIAGFLVPFVE